MKVSNTSKRLKELMEINGWKQVDLLRKAKPYFDKYNMNIDRSYISLWVAGRYEPNQPRLSALSEAFGVSETWLMGYDVPMQKTEIIDYESMGVNAKENFNRLMTYCDKLMKLKESDREMVLSMIERLDNKG